MSELMVKQRQSIQASRGKNGANDSVNFHAELDDSLVNVEDLIKLQECNPEIAKWFMEAISLEQIARHKDQEQKVQITSDNHSRAFSLDIVIIVSAVLICLVGMAFSAYLIYNDHVIAGSVFAGGVLLGIVNAVLNFKKPIGQNYNRLMPKPTPTN